MDRRSFIAATLGAGAGIAPAATAVACALDPADLDAKGGQEVRLSGWLVSTAGHGHFATLMPAAALTAPASDEVADWPKGAVRVLARDTRQMPRFGQASVVGRLQVGHFVDEVTGQAAGAVLLDARLA